MPLKMARDAKRFYQQYSFMYKDVLPLPIVTNENAMKEFELMELREDDLFVVTYPKSGTHWMQEIVHLILVNGHGERLTAKERRPVIELADIRSHDPELVAAAGPVLREMKDVPSPRVLTSHVQYSFLPKQFLEKRPKIIYIYRHPKDVLVSLFNFYLSFIRQDVEPAPFGDFFDDFTAGQVVFGSWFDHVNDYYKHKDDENFFALPFEAMKQDLHKVVQDVASFIGKPLDDNSLARVVEGASFETMKKSFQKDHEKNVAEGKDVMRANAFVRKGKVGQWKDLLTPAQNKLLDELFREKMKDCEWTRSYAPDSANE
ncbi:Sulfotransferase family cytosolic 2B member 1 [Holothuria leucospilota]|uniref:Sulfotransferase family cytosolic 2B member 1 n=1 Tax=Holothuria leucospilota TaxID=206669 RepID=A0A9Q0YN52_HOLLE|nr:Sulfotransferase family cytosolic 2B member 1 [Holothuria leucospilota]